MQEQDRGRILRAGLAVEDGQAVDVDGAVRRLVHGYLRSHQGSGSSGEGLAHQLADVLASPRRALARSLLPEGPPAAPRADPFLPAERRRLHPGFVICHVACLQATVVFLVVICLSRGTGSSSLSLAPDGRRMAGVRAVPWPVVTREVLSRAPQGGGGMDCEYGQAWLA